MALSRVIIPTARPDLVLRQYTLADSPAIFAAIDASREHLSQNGDDTSQKYPTLTSVEEGIRVNNPEAHLRLGIWARETFVGGINLTCSLESAEVGYWLDVRQTGRGYATLATQAVVRYAREVLGYNRVWACVKRVNQKSLAVLHRAGFIIVQTYPELHHLHHLLPAP